MPAVVESHGYTMQGSNSAVQKTSGSLSLLLPNCNRNFGKRYGRTVFKRNPFSEEYHTRQKWNIVCNYTWTEKR